MTYETSYESASYEMKHTNKAQRGFTLFELCISLIIVGIFVGGALLSTGMYFQAQKVKTTREKIALIENALSAYVQTHYRLPCPADPGATAVNQGREIANGNCFANTGNLSDTYWTATGVVPWKELGLPQEMAMDGWNRYITYKPSPNLTVNTLSADMQTATNGEDVHNACRTAMWFDENTIHMNKAKALFCCNASPNFKYLTNVGQPGTLLAGWRDNGVVTTTNTIDSAGNSGLAGTDEVIISNSWHDDNLQSTTGNNVINTSGSFTEPNNGVYPASPLLRATSNAVTLISHGSNGAMAFMPNSNKNTVYAGTINDGSASSDIAANTELQNAWPPQKFAGVMGLPKAGSTYNPLGNLNGASDDIVSYVRSDQLFGRVGNASCNKLPAITQPYECIDNDITEMANKMLKDPISGATTVIPKLYALALPESYKGKYKLQSRFIIKSSKARAQNTFGNYTVAADGTLQNVEVILKDAKSVSEGTTIVKAPEVDSSELGVGIFILPNGYNINSRLQLPASDPNAIVFGKDPGQFTLKFQKSETDPTPSKITDTTPPVLAAYKNGSSEAPVILKGRDNKNAYHMYSNLNDENVNRIMTPENHKTGAALDKDQIGFVKDSNSGANQLNVAFEDKPEVTCFYKKGDHSKCTKDMPVEDREVDEYGGYWGKVGDEDYDDVVFGYNLVACKIAPPIPSP